MKIKTAIQNGFIVLIASFFTLVICEGAAHLVLNPADYLSAPTVRDDILGITIAPGTKGFDEWGFRNPAVPQTADIVAIGDSHTYGNNAAMSEAWPAVLAQRTGLRVYNLGLGGYGPNQYYQLLTTRGVRLKPRWVLCGLYFGDDFENSFSMTYGKQYWSFLRTRDSSGVNADIWEVPEQITWHRGIRMWLSENSVIYRLVVHGPVLGKLKGLMQIRQAERTQDPAVTTLHVPEERIQEAFRPIGIERRLDQSNPAVREGLRITLELLGRMDTFCRENGCQFAVVFIPTKETVFADYLLRESKLHLRPEVERLIANERRARDEVRLFLEGKNIPYVDTLAPLQGRVSEQLYTASDGDMHPNHNGYRVIGETVAVFLQQRTNTLGGESH